MARTDAQECLKGRPPLRTLSEGWRNHGRKEGRQTALPHWMGPELDRTGDEEEDQEKTFPLFARPLPSGGCCSNVQKDLSPENDSNTNVREITRRT